jgi:hypothetical protein
VLNDWIIREAGLLAAIRARLVIVKSVRAGRMLPWICRNFPLRAPIVLIRHPCAVVASQLRSPAWANPSRPETPPFLDGFPAFDGVLGKIQTKEEMLAATWALDYLLPLLAAIPRPWQVLSYEELALDPVAPIERLFDRWNMPLPRKLAQLAKVPSSMTYASGISGVEGWTRQLSGDQVERILSVTHGLGLSFYDEKVEPDYDLLHSQDLPAKIAHVGAAPRPRRQVYA